MEDFAVTFVKLACSQFSVNVPEEGFLGKFFVCKKLLLLGIDYQQMSSFGNDGRPSSRFGKRQSDCIGNYSRILGVTTVGCKNKYFHGCSRKSFESILHLQNRYNVKEDHK
jgi:hypothetical protein